MIGLDASPTLFSTPTGAAPADDAPTMVAPAKAAMVKRLRIVISISIWLGLQFSEVTPASGGWA